MEAMSSGACSVTGSSKLFKSAVKSYLKLAHQASENKTFGKVSKGIWMYSHLKKDIKSKHKAYEKLREKRDWSASKGTP